MEKTKKKEVLEETTEDATILEDKVKDEEYSGETLPIIPKVEVVIKDHIKVAEVTTENKEDVKQTWMLLLWQIQWL